MENIIISNPKEFEEKKKKILKQGINNFHVLTDFDRTLTKAFVNKKKTPSVISVLRDGNYISKQYAKKAHELFDKYHPIENDSSIPLKERKKAMHSWWSEHFELLIKSGLKKSHIEKIIKEDKIQFRKGAFEFFDYLNEKQIPLIILSSAGLGTESISLMLEKYKKNYKNIHIISNEYIWDEKGNAIEIKKPIIHCMNKDETILKDFPEIYEKIKNKKNVLLLGDSDGDLEMITGFDYDNLLKIGFLNDKVAPLGVPQDSELGGKENLERYKENFDVVITNDSNMNYVLEFVREMS